MLITRPRRWGKTLNMDMFRTFFQPDVDEFGKIKKTNKNKILFEGGEVKLNETDFKTLKPLAIANASGGKYLKEQGEHPVIFITFGNVYSEKNKDLNQKQTLSVIKQSINQAFEEHKYIYWSLLEANIKAFETL